MVQEVLGDLAGKCVVRISAGKERTVAITDTGEMYAWEAGSQATGAHVVPGVAALLALCQKP
jgi:alpha-tubulin suppressor-like RCC1 family protein